MYEVIRLAGASLFPDAKGPVYIVETENGKEISIQHEYLYSDQIREINGGIGKGGRTLITLD